MPRTSAVSWSDVRDAIAGRPRDYTTGGLPRAVLLLAIPMVLEMAMQALFSVADVFFVGRLGPDAVAAVGLTDSLLALVFAGAMGLSMGTTAMVARRIGEGNHDRAAEAAVQAILAGVLLSLPVSWIGVAHAPWLFRLMGAEASLVEYGWRFGAIMLGGNATVVLLFLINAAFRGAGDPARAMRALALANLLNIVLDPLLIFGLGPVPALGLEGAAIATTLSRGVGVLYQLRALSRSGDRLRVARRHLVVVPAVMRRLVRISAVGVLQFLVSTASFVWLFRILAWFGPQALAGYTIAIRVIIFILLPAWGMGNAAATLVGQNLGAGQPDRAQRSVWLTAWANTAFLTAVAVILLFAARPIAAIFSDDAQVIGVAADCLRIVSYSYAFWGFGMVTVLAFNGAGDTTTPTWINLIAYWILQLPLAWWLSLRLGLGPRGVFVAIALGQAALALIGVLWFRRGSWKQREV